MLQYWKLTYLLLYNQNSYKHCKMYYNSMLEKISGLLYKPECVITDFVITRVYYKLLNISFFRILFSSSVLNLAELVALRPDLSKLQKILYFHENQLAYPKQEEKPRDVQYGYNQILSWYVSLSGKQVT